MKRQFEVGDRVWLKSGSPALTVRDIRLTPDDQLVVLCEWFADGERQGLELVEACFTLTEPPARA